VVAVAEEEDPTAVAVAAEEDNNSFTKSFYHFKYQTR